MVCEALSFAFGKSALKASRFLSMASLTSCFTVFACGLFSRAIDCDSLKLSMPFPRTRRSFNTSCPMLSTFRLASLLILSSSSFFSSSTFSSFNRPSFFISFFNIVSSSFLACLLCSSSSFSYTLAMTSFSFSSSIANLISSFIPG